MLEDLLLKEDSEEFIERGRSETDENILGDVARSRHSSCPIGLVDTPDSRYPQRSLVTHGCGSTSVLNNISGRTAKVTYVAWQTELEWFGGNPSSSKC